MSYNKYIIDYRKVIFPSDYNYFTEKAFDKKVLSKAIGH